jgi:hypothetical protein
VSIAVVAQPSASPFRVRPFGSFSGTSALGQMLLLLTASQVRLISTIEEARADNPDAMRAWAWLCLCLPARLLP